MTVIRNTVNCERNPVLLLIFKDYIRENFCIAICVGVGIYLLGELLAIEV